MESGFLLDDPKVFALRVYQVLKGNLDISPDAQIDEELEIVEEDEKEAEAEPEYDEVSFSNSSRP